MAMPPTKSISPYWHDLFEWFEDHPNEQVTIEMESPTRAQSLRFEFYRVRSSALKNSIYQERYVNTAIREATIELVDLPDGTKVPGRFVTFRLKSHSPILQSLATALKKQGIGEPQPDGLGKHSDVDNGAL